MGATGHGARAHLSRNEYRILPSEVYPFAGGVGASPNAEVAYEYTIPARGAK